MSNVIEIRHEWGPVQSPRWFESHDNVLRLARWMNDNWLFHDKGSSGVANLMLYYFSKPWKYEQEWNDMLGEEAGTRGQCDCGACEDWTDLKVNDEWMCSDCQESLSTFDPFEASAAEREAYFSGRK